jgi:hypothetical protein
MDWWRKRCVLDLARSATRLNAKVPSTDSATELACVRLSMKAPRMDAKIHESTSSLLSNSICSLNTPRCWLFIRSARSKSPKRSIQSSECTRVALSFDSCCWFRKRWSSGFIETNHVIIGRSEHGDFSVRGILYRSVKMSTRLYTRCYRPIHVLDSKGQPGRVACTQLGFVCSYNLQVERNAIVAGGELGPIVCHTKNL